MSGRYQNIKKLFYRNFWHLQTRFGTLVIWRPDSNSRYSTSLISIFTFLNFYLAYTTVKTNAMCSPSDTYGLTRRLDLKTLEECAQAARDAGVNLFVACQNSRFLCYIYTKTRYSTTCASKHNRFKCNVYKVAGAPLSTIGKYRIISYPYLTCKGVLKIIVSIMFFVLFWFLFSDF